MSEAPTCTGEEVLIVGAGNSAGQAAIHLAGFASRVTMVVRGQEWPKSKCRVPRDKSRMVYPASTAELVLRVG